MLKIISIFNYFLKIIISIVHETFVIIYIFSGVGNYDYPKTLEKIIVS